jgi:hypothetical protein
MRREIIVMVVAAAAAVVALCVGVTASNAERKRACDGGKCRIVCREEVRDGTGATVDYEEGTTITIREKDGKVRRFKCTDGHWVQIRLVGGQQFKFPTTRK